MLPVRPFTLLPAVLNAVLRPVYQVISPAASKIPTAAIMTTVEVASAVAVSSRNNLLRPFIPVPPAPPGPSHFSLNRSEPSHGRAVLLTSASNTGNLPMGEALAGPPSSSPASSLNAVHDPKVVCIWVVRVPTLLPAVLNAVLRPVYQATRPAASKTP